MNVDPANCTTVVHLQHHENVRSQGKSPVRKISRSVRVTIPAKLARKVRRVAKVRKMTMSRALVTLVEQGVEAEAAAKAKLAAAYEQFTAIEDPSKRSEVGRELIQAIFGRRTIAEDPLR